MVICTSPDSRPAASGRFTRTRLLPMRVAICCWGQVADIVVPGDPRLQFFLRIGGASAIASLGRIFPALVRVLLVPQHMAGGPWCSTR